MQSNSKFARQKKEMQEQKLSELLQKLPRPAVDYIYDKKINTTLSTRISYAYDLLTFFNFLIQTNPMYCEKMPEEFTDEDLGNLTRQDLVEYRSYLGFSNGIVQGTDINNSNRSISKKFAALRGMYQYLLVNERVEKNPAEYVALASDEKKKTTIFMEKEEIAMLLEYVEKGEPTMTAHQKAYCNKTRTRDIALIYILLGTGIRVSECQGLDIRDIDFRQQCFPVIRKGEHLDMIYFNDEVAKALKNYIEGPRALATPMPGHEEALFLSMQNKRMSVDSIEKIVTKYTRTVCSNKKITVHKLRSTFATLFYSANQNDLIATQHALGHENPNTTAIYTGLTEADKKKARTLKLVSGQPAYTEKEKTIFELYQENVIDIGTASAKLDMSTAEFTEKFLSSKIN